MYICVYILYAYLHMVALPARLGNWLYAHEQGAPFKGTRMSLVGFTGKNFIPCAMRGQPDLEIGSIYDAAASHICNVKIC